jgi:hypothetical protein
LAPGTVSTAGRVRTAAGPEKAFLRDPGAVCFRNRASAAVALIGLIHWRSMSEPTIPVELFNQAVRIFGDKAAARAWFFKSDLNLLGRRPIDAIELGDQEAVAVVLDGLGVPEDNPC